MQRLILSLGLETRQGGSSRFDIGWDKSVQSHAGEANCVGIARSCPTLKFQPRSLEPLQLVEFVSSILTID